MITSDTPVRHPLYPELGVGQVLHITKSSAPSVRVDWAEVGRVSTHALAVLRPVGNEAGLDPREAIARSSGTCSFSARHAAPHDHVQCLLDADAMLTALALVGFRVIGVTELDNIQEATA